MVKRWIGLRAVIQYVWIYPTIAECCKRLDSEIHVEHDYIGKKTENENESSHENDVKLID